MALRVALLLLLLAGAAIWWRWSRAAVEPPRLPEPTATVSPTDVVRIREFCGACHAPPDPASFPRDAWHAEVIRGYRFYAMSGRHDLDPPPPAAAVRHYRDAAPLTLQLPEELAQAADDSSWFDPPAGVSVPAATSPGVAGFAAGFEPHQAIASDMRSGDLWLISWKQDGAEARSLARLKHPCHLHWSDVDGDRQEDLLVADLGSFFADERREGEVVWLRRNGPDSLGPPRTIAGNIARTSDVRGGDFNGDGRTDLLVAGFGWNRSGGVQLLLQQPGEAGGEPSFRQQTVDQRAGAVHLIPDDLDGDGRLDFLALVSQQHEQIDAFLQQPGGDEPAFQSQAVWEAGDPSYGSSGMRPCDLDGDGDLDLLYTHGDTFDGEYVKPSHAVLWLENRGALNYRARHLAFLPGAYCAAAADFDLDGDLDVAAGAWLPDETFQFDASRAPSLLLLEQTSPGQFQRRVLERGSQVHAAVHIADIDGDGDADLLAGRSVMSPRGDAVLVDLWRNRAR